MQWMGDQLCPDLHGVLFRGNATAPRGGPPPDVGVWGDGEVDSLRFAPKLLRFLVLHCLTLCYCVNEKTMYFYTIIIMYVCMYACMYVYVYVCMYIMYVCMY